MSRILFPQDRGEPFRWRTAIRQTAFVVIVALICSPAHADSFFDAGTLAYGRGDLKAASTLWDQSTDPRAGYMLGRMAKEGKLAGCDPIYCAAKIFYKSGDAGYLPSLIELAGLNINNGHMEDGVDILKIAARWNDPDARRILGEMGRAVPPPDLYEKSVAEKAQAEMRQGKEQQATLRAQAQQEWVSKFMYGMALGAAMQPRRPVIPRDPKSYKCTSDLGSVSIKNVPTTYTCRER